MISKLGMLSKGFMLKQFSKNRPFLFLNEINKIDRLFIVYENSVFFLVKT